MISAEECLSICCTKYNHPLLLSCLKIRYSLFIRFLKFTEILNNSSDLGTHNLISGLKRRKRWKENCGNQLMSEQNIVSYPVPNSSVFPQYFVHTSILHFPSRQLLIYKSSSFIRTELLGFRDCSFFKQALWSCPSRLIKHVCSTDSLTYFATWGLMKNYRDNVTLIL